MRSLHLSRRTAALLLVPALLAGGALQDEPPTGSPVAAPPGTAATGTPRTPDLWQQAAPAAPATTPGRHVRSDQPVAAARSRGSAVVRVAAHRPSLQDRGHAALASLRYDWRALGYRVEFRPYDGRGLGSANRLTRLITVYVRPGQSDLSLRVSLAHELGHALDFEHGTQAKRDDYRRIRGLSPTGPWFPCERCSDYASPAGDFAEVFAAWLVGPGDFRSRLKGPPDARQLRELTPLFELPRSASAHRPSPAPAPSPEPDEDDEEETTLASVLDPVEEPPPGT